MKIKTISLKTVSTPEMGALSFFESEHDIPFEIRRIYYIHGVPKGCQRGGHAHKNLRQLLFCVYGKIELFLDNGYEKTSVILDDPQKGVILDQTIWRDMLWLQDNSVLCVAADAYYDESDYMRDYQDFTNYVVNKNEDLNK